MGALFCSQLAGCFGDSAGELAVEHINAMNALTELLAPITDVNRATAMQSAIGEALQQNDAAFERLRTAVQAASDEDVVQLDRQHGVQYESSESRLKQQLERLRRNPTLMAAAFGDAASSRLGIQPESSPSVATSGERPKALVVTTSRPARESPRQKPAQESPFKKPAQESPFKKRTSPPTEDPPKSADPPMTTLADVQAAQRGDDAAAIVRALKSVPGEIAAAEPDPWGTLLRQLINHAEAKVQEAAFELLIEADLATPADVGAGLKKNSPGVRNAALDGVREAKLAEHIPTVVEMLKYSEVRQAAARCLEAFADQGPQVEAEVLKVFQNHKFLDADASDAVCRVLGACGTDKSRELLKKISNLGAKYAAGAREAIRRIGDRKSRSSKDHSP